jgi:PAS domain S-box-containing protein
MGRAVDHEGDAPDTDRRIADLERRLEESERAKRFYRRLVERQKEGIGIVDLDERFTFANPAAEVIFGVAEGTLVGRSLGEFTDEVSFEHVRRQTRRRRDGAHDTYDLPFMRADGSHRIMRVTASPQEDEQGTVVGAFGVFQDITELEEARREKGRLELQLVHAQKMETAGRLAGGVAHDFNNVLTVIQGSGEMLLLKMRQDDPLAVLVQEILDATERASSLTRQLLAFSRRQVLEMAVLDPVRVVQKMEKMLRRLIGEDVEVVIRPGREVGLIRVDRGQIEQVLVNLAVNSRDAMPEGGRLCIDIDVVNVSGDEREVEDLEEGTWVKLSVIDEGVGMSPEVADRIFEPFFTTKEKSRGTGLGLSTVYGIVRQSGGHVRVRSVEGVGTTVDIYLPQAAALEEEEDREEARHSEPPGTATILVVEDDEPVRRLARMVLESKGYAVVEASRDTEALEALDCLPGPVHLALMDVVLPGRAGPDVARMLRDRIPGLPVLYMSGYTDEALGRHGVLEKGQDYIEKPFKSRELVRRVRLALERGS